MARFKEPKQQISMMNDAISGFERILTFQNYVSFPNDMYRTVLSCVRARFELAKLVVSQHADWLLEKCQKDLKQCLASVGNKLPSEKIEVINQRLTDLTVFRRSIERDKKSAMR